MLQSYEGKFFFRPKADGKFNVLGHCGMHVEIF